MSMSIYIGENYNIQMRWLILLAWLPSCYAYSEFIWYGLPSCERCERHKGAWRDVSKRIPSHITMGEINCEVDACENVYRFPTIKYNMYDRWLEYTGSIDVQSLYTFMKDIPPPCDMSHIENCLVSVEDVDKSTEEYIDMLSAAESFYTNASVQLFMDLYNTTQRLQHKIILSKVLK